MAKEELIIVANYSDENEMTLEELCNVCHISPDTIQHLIEFDIIHPRGQQQEWLFDLSALQRIQTALRLQRDLEINMAGVAIVLDLLDQMQDLRQQIHVMHRHFEK